VLLAKQDDNKLYQFVSGLERLTDLPKATQLLSNEAGLLASVLGLFSPPHSQVSGLILKEDGSIDRN
jgi:hypothetical protein